MRSVMCRQNLVASDSRCYAAHAFTCPGFSNSDRSRRLFTRLDNEHVAHSGIESVYRKLAKRAGSGLPRQRIRLRV